MKINFSDKRIIILLCIAIILLAVNIYLVLQPKGEDSTSMYKAFAEQTHSSIQSLKNSSESLSAELVEKPDMNAEEKADLSLLREFYNSMNSDIKWISEKENTNYWRLVSAQNPLNANELMRKEMAVLVVSNYVFALNNEALNDGFSGLLDENETIEEATASLSWIKVGDLLNDEVAQEMISGTLVKKEDILAETKLLMQEFLSIRETAFRQAKEGTDAKFVAAMNLLELVYLLEVNSAVPSNSTSGNP